MSFSFGASNPTATGGGGFSFGSTPAATGSTTTTNTGFNFGAPTTTTASTGSTAPTFSFGSTSTTAPATNGGSAFSFNATPSNGSTTVPATTTPAATTGFSFGSTSSTTDANSTGGFSFGAPATTPATTSTTSQPSTSGFSFAPSSTSTTAPLSFGAPATTTTTTSSTPSTGFGFGTPAKTESPKPTAGATTTATPSSGFSFGGTTTDASKPADASSSGFGFGSSTNTTASTSTTTTAPLSFGAVTSTPTNTTSSILKKPESKNEAPAVSSTPSTIKISDAQSKLRSETVETIIRNWNNELSEDVTEFKKYADQVSRWDRDLLENEEKIARLMKSIEFIEANQEDVDTQIGAIEEKQKKLNEALQTMEGDIQQAFDTSKLQLPDEERKNTYNLADNINKQLDGMSRSLKDMIETLNNSYDNTLHKNTDTNNIVKILNNHLNSLQWIDHKTGSLHQQIQKAEDEVRRLRL